MTKISELHREWSKDPEYREAYDRLGPEFVLARTLIEARRSAALTQPIFNTGVGDIGKLEGEECAKLLISLS